MMAVESREQVLAILREHREELRRYGVKRCGLFGSFKRATQDSRSDVDIIVEFEEGKKSFDNFMQVAFFLETVFGRRVDCLLLNR